MATRKAAKRPTRKLKPAAAPAPVERVAAPKPPTPLEQAVARIKQLETDKEAAMQAGQEILSERDGLLSMIGIASHHGGLHTLVN